MAGEQIGQVLAKERFHLHLVQLRQHHRRRQAARLGSDLGGAVLAYPRPGEDAGELELSPAPGLAEEARLVLAPDGKTVVVVLEGRSLSVADQKQGAHARANRRWQQ